MPLRVTITPAASAGAGPRRSLKPAPACVAAPVVAGALVAFALGACRAPESPRTGALPADPAAPAQSPTPAARPSGSATPPGGVPAARLPAAPGRFGPAHTELAPGSAIDGVHLSDVDTCADCHADIAAQWQASAHAFASFSNPVYRVSIEGFRAARGPEASRFCGGCHDIALLVDGALDRPDAELAPGDARAHTGVSCRVCHGVSAVRPDGNGSYTLAAAPIPLPRDGDDDSLAEHRRVASRDRLGASLCTPCHRSFLGPETGHPHHLSGMDDAADWQSSAFSASGVGRVDDPVPRETCIDCHMPRVAAPLGDAAARDGQVASHLFPGGHTWLASMRGDRDTLARTQAFLRGVASLDIAAVVAMDPAPGAGPSALGRPTLPGEIDEAKTRPAPRRQPTERPGPDRPPPARSHAGTAAPPSRAEAAGLDSRGPSRPGEPGPVLGIDVVVRNRGAGHRFPGGVRDAQDTWIELVARDQAGRVVASSGLAHERDPDDREAHVLRASVADEAGHILLEREVHAFRAPMADHTVAPRDVTVVRYRLDPAALAGAGVAWRPGEPLELRARLRHRSRDLALQRAACAATRDRRGRAFDRAAERHRGHALDPCAPQPVTTLAERRVWIGADVGLRPGAGPADPAAPAWRRQYEHGLAWLHATQEHVGEAGPPLRAALGRLPAGATHERAMVLTALGALAGRQGRTAAALDWLAQAEAHAPGHPAIATARGAALTRVWRWREAVAPLAHASERAPLNRGAHAALAVTLGSLGRHAEALTAARRGLALAPRHEALLRVQALALAGLADADADGALAAYARHRAPDRASGIRFACAAHDPACAREQPPVHVHELTPATR